MVVMTNNGFASDMITKYRPPHPVIVVSPDERVLRQTNARFGQVAFKPSRFDDLDVVGREVRGRPPACGQHPTPPLPLSSPLRSARKPTRPRDALQPDRSIEWHSPAAAAFCTGG